MVSEDGMNQKPKVYRTKEYAEVACAVTSFRIVKANTSNEPCTGTPKTQKDPKVKAVSRLSPDIRVQNNGTGIIRLISLVLPSIY